MSRSDLHKAVVSGNLTKVNKLIADGADVNVQDNDGETPLHEAAINGHNEVVETLLDTESIKVNIEDNDNETPLHYAAAIGCLDVVKKLIKKQAKIDAQDKYGSTPLHYAAEYGYPNIVEELIKNGARVNIKNCSGRTPLDLANDSSKLKAIEEGRLDRVKLSLNNTKPIDIGHAADFKGIDKAKLQITKPKFDESQKYWQVYVSKNSNCLFLAVILAYLVPVKDNNSEFQDRFDRLYENLQYQQPEQVKEDYNKKLRDVQVLIKGYNPFSNAIDIYSTLNELVQLLRKRVGIDDPNAWGSDDEISRQLGCRFSVFSSTGTRDISVYRSDVQLPELKLFHDTTTAGNGNYYGFNLEKDIGGRYKQLADVDKRLREFIKYFVEEFEAKLHTYNMILEGEVIKEGKFSKTFSEMIGKAAAGAIGGILGLYLGIPTTGAKLVAETGEKLIKELVKKIDRKKQEEKAVNLSCVVDHFQKDKAKQALVEGGFDIFQSFEMQFIRVTTDLGPRNAMRRLAQDAVSRAISYYTQVEHAFVAEAVMLGKSKRGTVVDDMPITRKAKTPGFEIKYEYGSPVEEKEWTTGSLYEKAGLVVQEKTPTEVIKYYKKEGNRTDKYGYRRLLTSEDLDKLKYELDGNAKSKSKQFTGYHYVLDPSERVEGILKRIDLKKDLEEERIKEILTEAKDDIIKEINAFKQGQDRKIAEILSKIEDNLKNLKVDEYWKKFEQYFEEAKQERQEIAKSIGEGREENEKNFQKASKEHEQTWAQLEKLPSKVAEAVKEVVKQPKGEVLSKKSVWFEVRESVTSFTERQGKLDKIVNGIEDGIIVISGLGGVGKSELAIRYARSQYSKQDSVIWINAETRETAEGSFHRLYKELGFKIRDADGEEKNIRSVVKDVYSYFSSRRSLLIFDNAEKYTEIQEFLQLGLHSIPYVLVTSPNDLEWKSTRINIKTLPLGDFTDTEAKGLIKTVLEVENDSQDIANLAKELHNFPLALQQAANYIRDTNEELKKRGAEFKISDYLEKYKQVPRRLLSIKLPDGEYVRTIFKTLEITVVKIKDNEEYGQQALDMLNIMSYFAPSNIPEETFLNELAGGDKEKLISITRLLEKYLIVNLEQSMLNIHGLVQQIRRLEQKDEALEEETLVKALGLLKEHMKDHDSVERYKPHIISVWNYASKYNKLVENFIVEVDDSSTYYTTYFHLIAEESNDKIVSTVLDQIERNHPNKLKNFINRKNNNRDRERPLHGAVQSGKERTVELLKDADINVKKRYGWTSLHLAAKNGYLSIVERLLNKGAKINDQRTGYGFTPLHLAARNGYPKIVKLLLERGADVNAEDQRKYTSLHFAAKSGNLEVIEALLEKEGINVNVQTKYELTPLHFAIKSSNPDVVKALLDKRADVNAKKELDGFTPLHLAVLGGNKVIINYLLEGSEVKIDEQTTEGNTLLHLAAKNGHEGIIEVLLNKGADVHIKNKDGKTFLDLAREAGHIKVVDMLIDTKVTDVSLSQHQVSFLVDKLL